MKDIYLIQGDDEFSISEALEKIKSKFNKLEKGINYLTFDKDNFSQLESEITTYSFFDEPKLIVVNLPSKAKKEDDESKQTLKTPKLEWFSDSLKEALQNKIDNITICFVGETVSRGKFLDFANKEFTVINCNKLKPRQLTNWVIDYCKEEEMSISTIDAQYLIDVCGTNKQTISNEIQKLKDYVDDKSIRKDDIEKMCIRTPEVVIFDLTDCMGEKNIKKSLSLLDELLNEKLPIQMILVMMTRHFKSLLIAKECKTQGKSVESELKVMPFVAIKYSKQAQNFTMDELVSKFKALIYLDINSKIGNIDLNIGFQQFILSN